VLAGGSRERPLVSPPPVSFQFGPADPIPFRYSCVETFPGAAGYPTFGSATIFRAIMPAVWQQSKAAPLQAMGEVARNLSFPHFLCRGSNASRNPSPRKFNASNVLPIAIAGKTNNHQ
jgi:hypothetical protein